jgi:1-aminocyclopropane-1-carboxylate deaminase/D-cysteine desulfhydrase-like pyridoxal-dependent ACC family enzyme
VKRFPALSAIPRVALGHFPTPISALQLSPTLWIKRDDLCADPLGGNKVRALEFLLGDVSENDDVVTVGSEGSTHALAVATYGKRLGANVSVGRWKQEMNEAARRVGERVGRAARRAPIFRTPVEAFAWAWLDRARGSYWIPAGGSSPLGILGHVNAGLELVAQIDAGQAPPPKFVVVPLGTGGTAAGLALAFAIAQRDITVIGARGVPRIVAREPRVRRLANATAKLIERTAGVPIARVRGDAVNIVHESYGGAYGRETDAAKRAADQLRMVSSIGLDSTYSAKAFATALEFASRGPTLFWLTFDSRTLTTP